MKKLVVLLCILFTGIAVWAQPNYPAAPLPATNLIQLEYFVDTDPGAGNGKPVVLTASQVINGFSFDADLTGVANGFHRIYVRSRDANGTWSHSNNSYFDNVVVPAYAVTPAAAANIVEVEYFIDTDPGLGNGTKMTFAATQNVVGESIAVNVTGLSTGVHRLYIRSKTSDGKWSLTYYGLFDNSVAAAYPTAPLPAPAIGELEYYIDTDPGFGNGTPIVFTPGTDISNLSVTIPLNGISAGAHTIYFRSKQNPWSLSAYADFMYASTLPVTWLYVRGEIRNNQAVINWATSTEDNTEKFVIEHSTDGRVFTTAGEVAAAGNSNSSISYGFTHINPVTGANYYRIRQQDLDGRHTYSKVIMLLNRQHLKETVLAPNPVHDMLHITEPGKKWVRKIEIYDMNGRMQLSKTVEAEVSSYSLSAAALVKGTYVLKVFYKEGTAVFKLIKD